MVWPADANAIALIEGIARDEHGLILDEETSEAFFSSTCLADKEGWGSGHDLSPRCPSQTVHTYLQKGGGVRKGNYKTLNEKAGLPDVNSGK